MGCRDGVSASSIVKPVSSHGCHCAVHAVENGSSLMAQHDTAIKRISSVLSWEGHFSACLLCSGQARDMPWSVTARRTRGGDVDLLAYPR